MASGSFFKRVRVLGLLFILFIVGMDAYLTKIRTTDWDLPLRVVVYPVNGDGSEEAENYVSELTRDSYAGIETFLQEEAEHYRLPLSNPVNIRLAHEVTELPPVQPSNANVLQVMWWSLKLRYWSFRVDEYDGPSPNVRIYVVYHSPVENRRLDHSVGLEKGMIGVVNAFASRKMEEQNNIVITHELLHTVGATDKYNLETGQPLYPAGYVEPEKQPRFPQDYAEIMAGVIPKSQTKSVMAEGLYEVVIGKETAREINWLK